MSKTIRTGTIDITPSWQTAFAIYFEVIRTGKPGARVEALKNLESECMRLAKAVDEQRAK